MMSVDLRADMGFKHIPQLQFPAVGETQHTESKSCFVELSIFMQQQEATGAPFFKFKLPLHGYTCIYLQEVL